MTWGEKSGKSKSKLGKETRYRDNFLVFWSCDEGVKSNDYAKAKSVNIVQCFIYPSSLLVSPLLDASMC